MDCLKIFKRVVRRENDLPNSVERARSQCFIANRALEIYERGRHIAEIFLETESHVAPARTLRKQKIPGGQEIPGDGNSRRDFVAFARTPKDQVVLRHETA